jgi:hypothetical protein
MSIYAFTAPDKSMVVKDGVVWIPWDAVHGRPASNGFTYDKWVADGSPTPTTYALPAIGTKDVDAFASQRLAAGYADTGAGNTGKTWQCDDASIIKWTALASVAGIAIALNTQPVPSFTLIAADNSLITLTAPQLYALFPTRIMPWVSATIMFARVMKDNILAGNPPADVTIGWP